MNRAATETPSLTVSSAGEQAEPGELLSPRPLCGCSSLTPTTGSFFAEPLGSPPQHSGGLGLAETQHLGRVTVACSASVMGLMTDSLSVGFSRQGYWSGLPFPSPGGLPDLVIESKSLFDLLLWQSGSLPPVPPGKTCDGQSNSK